jgi:hypothetical protein
LREEIRDACIKRARAEASFTADEIAGEAGIDVPAVLHELERLAGHGELARSLEVSCPSCRSVVQTADDDAGIVYGPRRCPVCSADVTISRSDASPKFRPTAELTIAPDVEMKPSDRSRPSGLAGG